MKTLLAWLIKKFITKNAIKGALHAANARLAAKEATERTTAIMAIGEDVSATTAAYLGAFADDGKMDENELAQVNAQVDEMVDKYISDDDSLAAMVDALVE